MKPHTCIIICGPTASGKTDVAISLAKYFNTKIISADSRQCYKELDIAVAKPTPNQLASVPHYFVNSHSILQTVTAAHFEQYALENISEIFSKNNIAIIVGGTGLYIKAFTNGLDEIIETPQAILIEINIGYETNGLGWLQNQIEKEDRLFFENGEMQNPHRLMRALAVIRSTGVSIISQQTNQIKERSFNIIKIGIEVDRAVLYDRINNRVDVMVSAGLVEEAKQLYSKKHLNALQTVGYKELFSYFDGEITETQAIDLIKQHTRQYAKRQVTWFKKDPEIIWLQRDKVLEFVQNLKISPQQ